MTFRLLYSASNQDIFLSIKTDPFHLKQIIANYDFLAEKKIIFRMISYCQSRVLMRVTNSKIKFLTKDQNSYASKIPFIDNLKRLACASKQDLLELAILEYEQKTKWTDFEIPYARHYDPRLVYFLPHFSVRSIIKSSLYYRLFKYINKESWA